jgi:uncharacterized protein YndB with AHSA1/START domain
MANKTDITATPGGYEIVISRVFDADIEKVWRAYTEPELVVKWLGPRRLKGRIDNWSLEPGGKWFMVHAEPDGSAEYEFHGIVHDVAPQERMSRTFEFHGMPGHVSFETAYFEAVDGKTKVTAVSVFQSPEDRDGMIKSGLETGVVEGNERLDELLATL